MRFSTRNGLLGCSQFSAIINNVTVNIVVSTLNTQIGTDLEVEPLGHAICSCLTLLCNSQLFSKVVVTIYIPSQQQ